MILSRVSVDMWRISGMVFFAPGVCICPLQADTGHMDMSNLGHYLLFSAQIRKPQKSDPHFSGLKFRR